MGTNVVDMSDPLSLATLPEPIIPTAAPPLSSALEACEKFLKVRRQKSSAPGRLLPPER
jgi:hypothetical protein